MLTWQQSQPWLSSFWEHSLVRVRKTQLTAKQKTRLKKVMYEGFNKDFMFDLRMKMTMLWLSFQLPCGELFHPEELYRIRLDFLIFETDALASGEGTNFLVTLTVRFYLYKANLFNLLKELLSSLPTLERRDLLWIFECFCLTVDSLIQFISWAIN